MDTPPRVESLAHLKALAAQQKVAYAYPIPQRLKRLNQRPAQDFAPEVYNAAAYGFEPEQFRPCPFCGGRRLNLATGNNPPRYLHGEVYCLSCLAATPYFATPAEAVAHWNQRVQTDASGCPFCGASPHLVSVAAHVWPQYTEPAHEYAICTGCKAVGPWPAHFVDGVVIEAATLWRMREGQVLLRQLPLGGTP